MGHGGGDNWWDDLVDEVEDRLVDYFDWALEQIGSIQADFQAILNTTPVGTAEYQRAADAVTALSRASIRMRGQLHVARELYDRGLGPLSSDP